MKLEYTKDLTKDQKIQCIKDYEILMSKGSIGDCLLRDISEKIISNHTYGANVVVIMNHVANECYQYFAYEYLKNDLQNESTLI